MFFHVILPILSLFVEKNCNKSNFVCQNFVVWYNFAVRKIIGKASFVFALALTCFLFFGCAKLSREDVEISVSADTIVVEVGKTENVTYETTPNNALVMFSVEQDGEAVANKDAIFKFSVKGNVISIEGVLAGTQTLKLVAKKNDKSASANITINVTDSSKPEDPDSKPDTPQNPDTPDDPQKPDNPQTPDDPQKPDNPQKPDESENDDNKDDENNPDEEHGGNNPGTDEKDDDKDDDNPEQPEKPSIDLDPCLFFLDETNYQAENEIFLNKNADSFLFTLDFTPLPNIETQVKLYVNDNLLQTIPENRFVYDLARIDGVDLQHVTSFILKLEFSLNDGDVTTTIFVELVVHVS